MCADESAQSPPLAAPTEPGRESPPALALPAPRGSPKTKRVFIGDASAPAAAASLPGVLLACVAQACLAPLNAIDAALPVVSVRRAASIDYDFFLAAEPGAIAEEEGRGPDVHRRALLGCLATLRRVCRAWRDAIASGELVRTLYLNRLSHDSKCWWPARTMGHLKRAGEYIRTVPLPRDFGTRFSQLRRLSLANLRMQHLPSQLSAMLQLQELNLSGNTLQSLPPWFGTLRLLELQLGDPWTGGWADESPAHEQLCRLGRWLCAADADALPHTLRHLSLADIRALAHLPAAVRHMTNLSSLDLHATSCSIADAEYLTALPLKNVVLLNTPSAPPNLPAWISKMTTVEKLVVSNEEAYERAEDDAFASAVTANLRTAFRPAAELRPSLASGLRSLRLEDLQLEAVPASLRGMARLEELNLSGWSLLHTLPDWLGELPLRKLLANNCYSLESDALPTSFASLGQHRRLHASLPAGLYM